VISGAGAGGSVAIRELLSGQGEVYKMVGLIDDNPDMAKTKILGYPVVGDYDALEPLIINGGVDIVVLSTRLIEGERLNRLKALCSQHQVSLARLHFELDHLVAVS
jgi:FlaA1/EpsC-like NDP-sugar epimerase